MRGLLVEQRWESGHAALDVSLWGDGTKQSCIGIPLNIGVLATGGKRIWLFCFSLGNCGFYFEAFHSLEASKMWKKKACWNHTWVDCKYDIWPLPMKCLCTIWTIQKRRWGVLIFSKKCEKQKAAKRLVGSIIGQKSSKNRLDFVLMKPLKVQPFVGNLCLLSPKVPHSGRNWF